jgi:hypothetical protein
MSRMVGDPGRRLDHLDDARKRPHVRRVAMGERPSFQLGHDLFELAFAEPGHPSRPTGPSKGAVATGLPIGVPTAHALARHLELSGHVGLALPLREEPACLTPSVFQPGEVPSRPGPDRRRDNGPRQQHERKHGTSLTGGSACVTVLCEAL